MTDNRHQMFNERYEKQEIPWDTGIVPPEIVQIVETLSAGKALDLGCGTGTMIRYLLEHGWQVDGVDFVQKAIEQAQTKLADFSPENYALYCHDVTKLTEIDSLRQPYQLVIDIGCGHSLSVEQGKGYVRDIASLMSSQGLWMLYAHLPSADRSVGWSAEDVQAMVSPYFKIVSQVLSTDTSVGFGSGWYQMRKLPN